MDPEEVSGQQPVQEQVQPQQPAPAAATPRPIPAATGGTPQSWTRLATFMSPSGEAMVHHWSEEDFAALGAELENTRLNSTPPTTPNPFLDLEQRLEANQGQDAAARLLRYDRIRDQIAQAHVSQAVTAAARIQHQWTVNNPLPGTFDGPQALPGRPELSTRQLNSLFRHYAANSGVFFLLNYNAIATTEGQVPPMMTWTSLAPVVGDGVTHDDAKVWFRVMPAMPGLSSGFTDFTGGNSGYLQRAVYCDGYGYEEITGSGLIDVNRYGIRFFCRAADGSVRLFESRQQREDFLRSQNPNWNPTLGYGDLTKRSEVQAEIENHPRSNGNGRATPGRHARGLMELLSLFALVGSPGEADTQRVSEISEADLARIRAEPINQPPPRQHEQARGGFADDPPPRGGFAGETRTTDDPLTILTGPRRTGQTETASIPSDDEGPGPLTDEMLRQLLSDTQYEGNHIEVFDQHNPGDDWSPSNPLDYSWGSDSDEDTPSEQQTQQNRNLFFLNYDVNTNMFGTHWTLVCLYRSTRNGLCVYKIVTVEEGMQIMSTLGVRFDNDENRFIDMDGPPYPDNTNPWPGGYLQVYDSSNLLLPMLQGLDQNFYYFNHTVGIPEFYSSHQTRMENIRYRAVEMRDENRNRQAMHDVRTLLFTEPYPVIGNEFRAMTSMLDLICDSRHTINQPRMTSMLGIMLDRLREARLTRQITDNAGAVRPGAWLSPEDIRVSAETPGTLIGRGPNLTLLQEQALQARMSYQATMTARNPGAANQQAPLQTIMLPEPRAERLENGDIRHTRPVEMETGIDAQIQTQNQTQSEQRNNELETTPRAGWDETWAGRMEQGWLRREMTREAYGSGVSGEGAVSGSETPPPSQAQNANPA